MFFTRDMSGIFPVVSSAASSSVLAAHPLIDPLLIAVIGAGYVGLTTAAAFALAGHRVIVVESNPEKLETLRDGRSPFFEPGLDQALQRCAARIEFTSNAARAVREAAVTVIAVGTPLTDAGIADLSQLYAVANVIAPALERSGFRTLVIKSTVPVGTTRALEGQLRERTIHADFAIASNPEFLRQGQALRDAVRPDRIVIGTQDQRALTMLRRLYKPLLEGRVNLPDGSLEIQSEPKQIPFLEVSLESAELAKYAANAFLAMKISYANEIANVCDALDANIDQVLEVLTTDPRIGPSFLRPGLGYGGSCFPKDTQALSSFSLHGGYDFRLLKAVIEVNAAQRFHLLGRLEAMLGGFDGSHIAVLGLSFKPGTDDVRESIGLELAHELQVRGAGVRVHDPLVRSVPGFEVMASLEMACANADAALVVTEWPEYIQANWTKIARTMRTRIVLDGRNALEPERMTRAGFVYLGVGRGTQGLETALREDEHVAVMWAKAILPERTAELDSPNF
jgi:UDPglucose 6-dehydrogenase